MAYHHLTVNSRNLKIHRYKHLYCKIEIPREMVSKINISVVDTNYKPTPQTFGMKEIPTHCNHL